MKNNVELILNMAILIKRLCYANRRYGESDLAETATRFLEDNGLIGYPLRESGDAIEKHGLPESSPAIYHNNRIG